jgi:hypothetical protein
MSKGDIPLSYELLHDKAKRRMIAQRDGTPKNAKIERW